METIDISDEKFLKAAYGKAIVSSDLEESNTLRFFGR
jgi:hypothetical protein